MVLLLHVVLQLFSCCVPAVAAVLLLHCCCCGASLLETAAAAKGQHGILCSLSFSPFQEDVKLIPIESQSISTRPANPFQVSVINEKDTIEVDQDTLNMLKEMGMDNLPKLQLIQTEIVRGGRH